MAGASYGDLRVGDGAPASGLKVRVAEHIGGKDKGERVRSFGWEGRAVGGEQRGSAEASEGIALPVRRAVGGGGRPCKAGSVAAVMRCRS